MSQQDRFSNGKQPDLSQIIQDYIEGDEHSRIFEKLGNLLEAASELVAELQLEQISAEHSDQKIDNKGLLHTLQIIFSQALNNPELLAKHYAQFATQLLQIIKRESTIDAASDDRRFKDNLWRESAFYKGLMQIYLAWSEHMKYWIDEQQLDEEDKKRANFLINQLISALAPSNLPINPAALKRVERSTGMAAVAGIKNWIQDIRSNNAMPRQINDNAYQLGVDLATTPGRVIYRNAQLELIQYQPQTSHVRRRPLLLIPPQINKYYVFDLKPRNSIIYFLLKQGFQLFAISWKNPSKDCEDWGLEAYIAAILQTLEVIASVSRSRSLNLISACAGGFTACALMGYLANNGIHKIHSHSLLVTALLPGSGSIMESLATGNSLELAKKISQSRGTMNGRDLAHIFAWLRPDDLIWKYWVNNNIMGRQPPPLDVLYWDNDSTLLPAKLHHDFINMYLKDVFNKPGQQIIFGQPIDYRRLSVDTYFLGGENDYLMPWRGIYQQIGHFRGKHRFVLSDSGHVQSILRPPQLPNTHYFTNDSYVDDADMWLSQATRHEGSWWTDWIAWLQANSGSLKKSPKRMGNHDFPAMTKAPGDYVKDRIAN